jgi:hypothetical protein
MRVYLDRLVIDGGVGGAMVIIEGERRTRESRFHLGTVDTHTVYEGEVVCMMLTVKLLKAELKTRGGNQDFAYFLDPEKKQAAILFVRHIVH